MTRTQPPAHPNRYEKAAATRRAKRQARIDEFDFLTGAGEDPARAAVRAGWPTIEAAEIALRRAAHPAAPTLNRITTHHRRHERRAA